MAADPQPALSAWIALDRLGSTWIGLDTAPRAPPPCRPRRRSSCSLSFVGSFRPVLPSPSYQRQLVNLDHLDHLDHLDTLPPPMPPVLSLSSFVRSSSSFVRSSKSIPLTSTSTRHLPLAPDAPSRAFRVFASISSLRALHLPAGIPRASRRPSVRPNPRSPPVQGLVWNNAAFRSCENDAWPWPLYEWPPSIPDAGASAYLRRCSYLLKV